MTRNRHLSASWPPATSEPAGAAIPETQPGLPASAGWAPQRWNAVLPAERSCCCSAPPAVQAVLRPAADRPSVELLLCGHHFRESRAGLAGNDAAFFDVHGAPMSPDADGPVQALPEPLYP
jgi:hypothetical protein